MSSRTHRIRWKFKTPALSRRARRAGNHGLLTVKGMRRRRVTRRRTRMRR